MDRSSEDQGRGQSGACGAKRVGVCGSRRRTSSRTVFASCGRAPAGSAASRQGLGARQLLRCRACRSSSRSARFRVAAVLLAGARKTRGCGTVYCVDPFDCSGDEFSATLPKDIGRSRRRLAARSFRRKPSPRQSRWLGRGTAGPRRGHRAGLDHADRPLGAQRRPVTGRGLRGMSMPLAVSQTRRCHRGARLRPGPRPESHGGNRRIVEREITPPAFTDIRLVVATTFARRAM